MAQEPYILESKQEIALPLSEVFPFFAAPENLEAITPPWLNFRILTPSPIRMQEGAIIDYSIRLRGVPMRWRTRITEYRPPHKFIDMQIRGPYLLWEHTHTFEAFTTPDGRDATRIVDLVRYIPRDVPGWIPFLGGTLQRWMVRPELERIFRHRRNRIAQLLGSTITPSIPFAIPG